MRLGPMRFVLEIQEESKTKTATLGTNREWILKRRVYGAIEPISAREYTDAAQQKALATHVIRIHFYSELNVKHRFKHGSKLYEITGIRADQKTGKHFQLVDVKEVI